MILEESLVGNPLVQIVWQRLQDSEMRHAVNHAGRVCSDVRYCEGDFVFEASLAFHVAEGRYAMHSFV